MTTNQTPETSTEPKADEKDPAWYREQMESAKKVNTDLQSKLERLAFKGVGLDPETGMGKAIKMTFAGDLDPENLDPLIEHAKSEFDLELKTTDGQVEPGTAKPEISAAEGRMAGLEGASTPTEPNVLQEKSDAELEKGNVEGSIAASIADAVNKGNLDLGGPSKG